MLHANNQLLNTYSTTPTLTLQLLNQKLLSPATKLYHKTPPKGLSRNSPFPNALSSEWCKRGARKGVLGRQAENELTESGHDRAVGLIVKKQQLLARSSQYLIQWPRLSSDQFRRGDVLPLSRIGIQRILATFCRATGHVSVERPRSNANT